MSSWFCVATNPRREERARVTLSRAGYGAYLPVRRIERQHRRTKAWQEFTLPLMPGYLFVEMPPIHDWWTLRRCDGVRGVLGFVDARGELRPCPVPSAMVERLMAAQQAMEFDETREAMRRRAIDPWPRGSTVLITDGPFATFSGEVDAHTETIVDLWVAILGRMTLVRVPIEQVARAA